MKALPGSIDITQKNSKQKIGMQLIKGRRSQDTHESLKLHSNIECPHNCLNFVSMSISLMTMPSFGMFFDSYVVWNRCERSMKWNAKKIITSDSLLLCYLQKCYTFFFLYEYEYKVVAILFRHVGLELGFGFGYTKV